MTKLNSLPVETLRKRLRYDPETGRLYWKASDLNAACWNATFDGKEALTSKDKDGYLVGLINGKRCLAHRAAWALHYGEWPEAFMDHINHIRTDNRISSLRQVDRAGNQRNLSQRSDNTSGFNGVSWHKQREKWRVVAFKNKRQISLGLYDTFEAAVDARIAFNKANEYHANHGLPAR